MLEHVLVLSQGFQLDGSDPAPQFALGLDNMELAPGSAELPIAPDGAEFAIDPGSAEFAIDPGSAEHYLTPEIGKLDHVGFSSLYIPGEIREIKI